MADSDIVRSLIPDTETVFGPNEDQTMFTEDDIENFLLAAKGNVLRAAGYACLAISTSEALISKVIKTQDLSTNGAAVADSLTKKAHELFQRAKDDAIDDSYNFFQIIDYKEGWGEYPPELTEFGV